MLLTGHFFLGVVALTHMLSPVISMLSPVISKLIPGSVLSIPFHLLFTTGKGPQAEDLLNW